MGERYDQQDGAPQLRPDSNETVAEKGAERTATIGERGTEDEGKVAGQGLGQMKDAETEHRAPGAGKR